MEGTIAATYALIYRFLKQQSQTKAAEAVKRAAKPTVVLRDDIEQDGPSLEDIVKEWRTRATVKLDTDSSSEESESSDDSSSDSGESSDSSSPKSEDTSSSEGEEDDTSDSDDSGDDSEEAMSKKKPVERDTSATLSSSVGENGKASQVPKQSSSKDKNENSESDSSDSSSSANSASESPSSNAESSGSDETDSSDDSEEESTGQQPDENKTKSTSESSSESEDETDSEPQQERAAKRRKISVNKAVVTTAVASETSSDSEPDSKPQQKRDGRVEKRRKVSENEATGTTAVATGSQLVVQKKEGQPGKIRARFQRVKIQNITPDLLLNNDYQARGGGMNDYGERAHRDLVVTRGAGFRKEKNKKKKGAYRGGEITLENRSIKFDF